MVYGSPGTQFDVEDFESVEIIFKYKAMKKIDKYYNTYIMLYQGSTPTPEQSDKYAGTYFLLTRRGGYQQAVFSHHKLYLSGNPIVRLKSNPLLDTSLYEVELFDGEFQDVALNQVAGSVSQQ